jgi:hypothetical protein
MTTGIADTHMWFQVNEEIKESYCSFLGYGVMNNVPEEHISLYKCTPNMEVVLS